MLWSIKTRNTKPTSEFIQKTKSKHQYHIVAQTHFQFSLYKKDIDTLRLSEKINDTIINSYLMMLMAHREKLYFFNTYYFYKELFKDFDYNYDNVSTWETKLEAGSV